MALGFLGSLPHLDLDGDVVREQPGWAESSNKSPWSPTRVFPGTELAPKGTPGVPWLPSSLQVMVAARGCLTITSPDWDS